MRHQVRKPMKGALIALVLAGAPNAQAREAAKPSGVLAREVVLDERTVRGRIDIRTARDFLTTVEFPEEVLGTTCPGCSDWKGDGVFRMEVLGKGRYLAITAAAGDGRRTKPGEEPVGSMLVQLEHGPLYLHFETVERKSAADTRVVLRYPNRSAEDEYLRAEKAKLQAESAAKIQEEVRARFLRAFRGPHHCERQRGRTRNDDIVVEVNELCYFGREVILTFTIENRGSVPMEIGAVAVNKGTLESKDGDLSPSTIDFQQVSSGVMTLRLPESDRKEGPFVLTVSERAGKHRVVTVGGIEF